MTRGFESCPVCPSKEQLSQYEEKTLLQRVFAALKRLFVQDSMPELYLPAAVNGSLDSLRRSIDRCKGTVGERCGAVAGLWGEVEGRYTDKAK